MPVSTSWFSGGSPGVPSVAGPFRRDGLAVQIVGKRDLRPDVVFVQLVLERVGARLELAPLLQQGRLVQRHVPLDDGPGGAEAPLQNLQVVVGGDLPEERQEGLDLLQLDDGADDAGVGLGDGRLDGNQLFGQALRLRRLVAPPEGQEAPSGGADPPDPAAAPLREAA